MAKCTLSIVLDPEREAYALGEVISGSVRVTVDSDCSCNALNLALRWETHGRGNRTHGPESVQTLFRGTWRAGEEHAYPFSFEIPPGPVTYHGHLLNVDYFLRATADIPWAIDPKAERDFLVVAPPDGSLVLTGAESDPQHTHSLETWQDLQAGAGAAAVFAGVVLLCVGLGLLLVGGNLLVSAEPVEWFYVAVGGLLSALGAGALYFGLRNRLAERKLGPVAVELRPRRVPPGGVLQATIHFTPRTSLHLNRVRVRLRGTEVVVSGSGTNKTTHSHDLFSEVATLHEGGPVLAGEAQRLECQFALPPSAPLSFRAPGNSLRWNAVFHVDVAHWPDWSQQVPLLVLPPAEQEEVPAPL
ncbi:MAG: hypothetical protein D6731_21840 [Planctomycetota bacterium]|nr:MAG: hypothetical protein D6731_21840 [Planctomycetota bacterium]